MRVAPAPMPEGISSRPDGPARRPLPPTGDFGATSPTIGGEESHHRRTCDAEFSCDVFGVAGIGGHRVEKLLDEVVACGVQDHSGPQAAGLQAQPCHHEAEADYVRGDNGQAVPDWRSLVVTA